MAKKKRRSKSKINMSEEIRKLIIANPAIEAEECIAKLGRKGIKIRKQLFFQARSSFRKKTGATRPIAQEEGISLEAMPIESQVFILRDENRRLRQRVATMGSLLLSMD